MHAIFHNWKTASRIEVGYPSTKKANQAEITPG